MRARVRITDLSTTQWNRLQNRLRTEYDLSATASVCAEFESGHPQGEVRHVQMPVQEFATVITELAALDLVAASPRRLPVLPTPAMVRGLSATEAAQLAVDMNRETSQPKGVADAAVIAQSSVSQGYDPGFWDRRVNGAYGR